MTEEEMVKNLDTITSLLKQYGVILESDKQYPSVVGTILGEPVAGSWWGHPKGIMIYNVLKRFSVRADVLGTRLLSGKTTFVHERLWPQLLTIATSHEPWQIEGLSKDSKRLYETVTMKGDVRTDAFSKTVGVSVGLLGEAARDLEKRLLVYGEGFHSNIGSHAKRLETWDRWASDHKYKWNNTGLLIAKRDLEEARERLSLKDGSSPRLPWESKTVRKVVRK